jgi:hypothetical protein
MCLVLALLTGCGEVSSRVLGGDSADGGGGLDGAMKIDGSLDPAARDDAGAGADPCESWCSLEVACHVERAEQDIGEGFGGEMECTYPDPEGAFAHCLNVCHGHGSSQFPPGVPSECLACESENLRLSCSRRGGLWLDCTHACTRNFHVIEIVYQLVDDLSCRPVDAPAGAPVCEPGAGVWISASLSTMPSSSFSIVSTATVAELDPLTLQLPDSRLLTLHITGITLPALSRYDVVRVEVKNECLHFSCDARAILRSADGVLLLAIWKGDRTFMPSLPEVQLGYTASLCSSYHDLCSPVVQGDLTVSSTSEASLRLLPGARGDIDDFEVVHGHAYTRFDVYCSDAGGDLVSGAVVRRPE